MRNGKKEITAGLGAGGSSNLERIPSGTSTSTERTCHCTRTSPQLQLATFNHCDECDTAAAAAFPPHHFSQLLHAPLQSQEIGFVISGGNFRIFCNNFLSKNRYRAEILQTADLPAFQKAVGSGERTTCRISRRRR